MELKPNKLSVRILHGNDMYRDLIRVHWTERNKIKNGSIARARVAGGKPFIVVMRGCTDEDLGKIGMDHLTREHVRTGAGGAILEGALDDFTFENASLLEKIKWSTNSADPVARVATWIAVVSGIAGFLGLLLAVIGLYPVVKEIRNDWSEYQQAHTPSPLRPPPTK